VSQPAALPEGLEPGDPELDSRARVVQRAVNTWTGELVDLGGRNTLLYYRDLKQGTLDLARRTRRTRSLWAS
jgi:hypothetical protein